MRGSSNFGTLSLSKYVGAAFFTEVGVLGNFSDICGLLFTLCGILEFGDRVRETAAAGGLSVCQPESGVTCTLLPPTMMQGGDILNIENIVNIVTCILLPPTMMQGGDILNIENIVNIAPAFSFLPQ